MLWTNVFVGVFVKTACGIAWGKCKDATRRFYAPYLSRGNMGARSSLRMNQPKRDIRVTNRAQKCSGPKCPVVVGAMWQRTRLTTGPANQTLVRKRDGRVASQG